MQYQLYFSSLGAPQTGLTPTFLTYQNALTSASVTPPEITEIGGGWYAFSITPSAVMVGVVDGGVSLATADRYKPVRTPVSAATAFGSAQITVILADPVAATGIPDAEVVILNADESLIVNTGLTNSIGQLTAQLNPGTYIVRLRKDGYNFTTPQTLVVTIDGSVTYNGTQVGNVAADFRTIVVPNSPNLPRS